MQSEKVKLNELIVCPCRFCGGKPSIQKLEPITFIMDDCGCFHVQQLKEIVEKNIKYVGGLDIMFLIKLWNARNEKHNPFVGLTKEEALKKVEDDIEWKKHNPFLEGK